METSDLFLFELLKWENYKCVLKYMSDRISRPEHIKCFRENIEEMMVDGFIFRNEDKISQIHGSSDSHEC